jgi:malonyl-CoA decarboxylase
VFEGLQQARRSARERSDLARLQALDAAVQARRAQGAGADVDDALLLRRLCAFHLLHTSAAGPRPSDPVARFHLGNGARLERINVAADLSRKGLKQSHELMVNYLYDLDEIEANHERFVSEEVNASRAVTGLP